MLATESLDQFQGISQSVYKLIEEDNSVTQAGFIRVAAVSKFCRFLLQVLRFLANHLLSIFDFERKNSPDELRYNFSRKIFFSYCSERERF